MTTIATIASVPTENASRYLQQLCKHWSHKMEVVFNEAQGRISFPMGPIDLVASPDTLAVTLRPNPGADVAQMQKVVADHLNRFAFREGELVFDWAQASA
jgi:hypothetical protein